MKQRARTAAVVAATSLLAGGGLAAAVTGLAQPAPAVVQSNGAHAAEQSSQDAALSAAVHELMSRNRDVHHQLTLARKQLHHLDTKLHHERIVAVRVAAERKHAAQVEALAPVPTTTRPVGGYSSPPATHVTTRASGAAIHSSTTRAPQVHATTRASGATPHAARPKVHATTRASGARGHGRGDDGHEGGGHDD